MTRRLTTLALLALLAAGCSTAGASTESAAPAGGADPHAMVAAGATLLDVRTPREFAAGHPDGAINIPVGDLERRIAEVPSEHGVVVYCHSGVRSASAARLLRARGYEVHDLGSMSAW